MVVPYAIHGRLKELQQHSHCLVYESHCHTLQGDSRFCKYTLLKEVSLAMYMQDPKHMLCLVHR